MRKKMKQKKEIDRNKLIKKQINKNILAEIN